MLTVATTRETAAALAAVANLLYRQKIDAVFVGTVARAAYLGETLERGPIDAIALLGPQQKSQVAMMASNNGFAVDRDEVESAEEFDLVPMKFEGTRVHLLVASNALYGRIVGAGVAASAGELAIRVPRVEDFALLVQMGNDRNTLDALLALPGFDRDHYNRTLVSIGLRELVIRG